MKTRSAIFTAFLLLIFASCNNAPPATEQTAAAPSASELNKQAYREIVRAFETGVTDSLGKYVAENSVDHAPPVPGITSTGLQHLKDVVAFYTAAFSDMKFALHHLVVDGDLLIAHGTWSGTNSGPFMGGPATNKAVSFEHIDMFRFENGLMVEHWDVSDQVAFNTQLGLLPPQGPAPAVVNNPAYDWNTAVTSDPTATSKMKEVYNTVIGMIQSGDLSALDQYIAADVNEHMQIPGVTLPAGIEGVRQAMTMFKQAYPDLKMTVNHIAAEGDVLIAHVTVEGTLAAGVQGMPPAAAGKTVKFSDVDIIKFSADGKCQEHWAVGDHYTEMVQLGVIPAPAAAAAN